MNGCKLLVLKIRHLLLPTLYNGNCIQKKTQLRHIKSALHLWHLFLQGFDPHDITHTFYTASVFFSIHTNYSCLAIYQWREMYKLIDSRRDWSSPAAVENKITPSSPELQEVQYSSYSSSFLEANAKGAQVLLAPTSTQKQLGSLKENTRFPKKHLNVILLFILLFLLN